MKRSNSTRVVFTAITIFCICILVGYYMLKLGAVFGQENGVSDVQLLARAINGEARGEPYEGQVAVGAVILNRTRDPNFPKTIAE